MPRPTKGPTFAIGVRLASVLLLLAATGCQYAAPAAPTPASTSTRSTPPTPARSTSPATVPAPPVPSQSDRSLDPKRSLEDNDVYRVDLGDRVVGCQLKVRSPRPPLKNADLAPYLRTVVTCLVKAFAGPLADRGFTVTTPKLKTYRDKVSNPCGSFDQAIAPAYYCSRNQTIYVPSTRDNGREAYTIARLGYVGLVAHEFGHHLQALTGMLTEYGVAYYATKKTSTRDVLSRRLELQADCFEGIFLATAAKTVKLSATDRRELRAWHGYTGDEDPPKDRPADHGTSATQLRWLNRGLDSADFGRCNTWKASKRSVT